MFYGLENYHQVIKCIALSRVLKKKYIVKEGVINIIAFNITFGRKREVLI